MKRTTKAVIIYLAVATLLACVAVFLVVSRLLAMEVLDSISLSFP